MMAAKPDFSKTAATNGSTAGVDDTQYTSGMDALETTKPTKGFHNDFFKRIDNKANWLGWAWEYAATQESVTLTSEQSIYTLLEKVAQRYGGPGFTPVQQGGGGSQGTNKVNIGFASDASGLRVQVDATDYGKTWPISVSGNAATATTATNANHASSADNATNAGNATTANNASGNVFSLAGNSGTGLRWDGSSLIAQTGGAIRYYYNVGGGSLNVVGQVRASSNVTAYIAVSAMGVEEPSDEPTTQADINAQHEHDIALNAGNIAQLNETLASVFDELATLRAELAELRAQPGAE